MMSALALLLVVTLTQQPPVPRPFPEPGSPQPARPAQPVQPAPPPPASPTPPPGPRRPQTRIAPTEATLGVPLYPGAQFIASYDAGRGQRFYLFGSTAAFEVLVSYYRTLLKQRGELVFPVPATHQFDIGRFREETMAFPPSVTIKDYRISRLAGLSEPQTGRRSRHDSPPSSR